MNLSGKKILVTGADGFIGSHLVEHLLDLGHDVRAFVYYNSFGSWGWLDTLPDAKKARLEVFAGDIRDAGSVDTSMKGIDVAFHLAALIGIPYSYVSPESYVDTNVTGTLNILQAARRFETSRVLVTSTSEVYGTALYTPIDEKHPYQGQSPYSATKIGADRIAESYFRSFETPVTIVRPFNTYGPRQSARAIIPTIISQLLSGAEKIKLGSLHPTRDLVYAKDTAEGFRRLAECDESIGEEVNIATGEEITMGGLAEILISQLKPGTLIESDDERIRPGTSEVEQLLGCPLKLQRLTGWKPRTSLPDGLEQTTAWFSEGDNLKGYKPGIYNV